MLFHSDLSLEDKFSSQDSFLFHNSCKNNLPCNVTGLNRPNGSYTDAICFNTWRFDTSEAGSRVIDSGIEYLL